MPYFVNGQPVPEELIAQECKSLERDVHFQSIADEAERARQLRAAAEASAADKMLIAQTAANDPRPIDPAAIQQEMQRQKAQWGRQSIFNDGQLRQWVESQLRLQRIRREMVADAAKPTAEEVEAFFNANREQFRKPELFHASHIVKHVNHEQTEEQAEAGIQAALAELERDVPFAEVADKHSDCKDKGGDLGEFPAGHMVQEFDDAIRAIQPGQRSGIFTTPFGFHIALLHSRTEACQADNGPSDYGFGDAFCIPAKSTNQAITNYPAAAYPSPDGLNNEATAGDFLDSNTAGVGSMRDTVEFCDTSSPFTGQPAYVQLNDAAIAWAFTNHWLQYATINFNKGGGVGTGQPLVAPWFCAVSFVNPHDITEFPYSYGLAGTPGGPCNIGPNQPFCPPSTMYAPGPGFQLPITNGSSNPTMYYGNACLMNEGNMSTGCSPNPPATGGPACAMIGDSISIPNLPTPYSSSLPTGPNGWNFENLSQMQYGSTPTNMSKPGLQAYFQNEWNLKAGLIADPGTGTGQTNTGWEMFLNYYLWMQSCVDQQVYNILYGPNGLIHSPFWGNTIIIFTSDHGDYAGSHGLHAKGGALYEEVINVPLVISMPEQRASGQSAPIFLPYVCSSVDILPFIYSMALGNEAWRGNTGDMVYYLSNRESIADAIMQYNGTPTCNTQLVRQRRISAIPLGNPPGGTYNWQMYQPYVLHTADDYAAAYVSPFDHYEMPQPSHAIAFRTADPTALTSSTGCPSSEPTPANGATLYQGGKLGIYSYWNTCDPATLNAPIMPINLNYGQPSNTPPNSQYEFYNYSSSQPNVLETGNDYFTSGGAVTPAGQNYYNAFTASSVQDVQHELYYLNAGGAPSGSPTQQVQAAIQDAYNNYILWLTCMGYITGSIGQILNFGNYACPDNPDMPQQLCPTCASDTTCSPGSYQGQN